MPWQKWFLIHALELHPTDVGADGHPLFRFRKVILLVGRQNGKSTTMQALTLWRMFVDRCNLVIGTAQDLEIAESLWEEAVEMAQENEFLAPEIADVKKVNGKKLMKLTTGETYKVKAATRRGGRGLSGELVLLDELREHQSWDAWAAVTKTTNAKERAQIYGVSNAGDATSVVLRFLRKQAHARLGDPDGINANEDPEAILADAPQEIIDAADDDEDDDSLAIFEWSAPPGCDIKDRDGWAMANPALGYRVRESTLASDAASDPEWVFRTECLCQWSDGTLEGPFPPGTWDATRDDSSSIAEGSEIKAWIDVSWNRSKTHIGFGGYRDDGMLHGEIVASRAGTDWVKDWLKPRVEKLGIKQIGLQARGAPVSSLLEELLAEGLPIFEASGSDVASATGIGYDLVKDGQAWHRTQPVLDVAAATAVMRRLADGAWVWDRKKSVTDIAPLICWCGVLWLLQPKPQEPEKVPMIYSWTDESD